MMQATFIGNQALLKLPKTAFLSSRTIDPLAVLRCYDWATSMRKQGVCVISGFHSKLEKDVLDFLLSGNQPVIIVLARALYKTTPVAWQKALDENRLLVVSISPTAVRNSGAAAQERNRYIVEQAETVVFGSITPQSSLYPLYEQAIDANKEVVVLGE